MTEQSEIERNAFEHWHDCRFDVSASTAVKNEYGYPQNQQIQTRWQAWQACANRHESDEFLLLSVLADIRQKSGVGDKPMLTELADAIADKIKSDTQQANAWQPIESAPDKTPLLVFDGKIICAAERDGVWWLCFGATGWECENVFDDPTHWMPLPTPPQATGG